MTLEEIAARFEKALINRDIAELIHFIRLMADCLERIGDTDSGREFVASNLYAISCCLDKTLTRNGHCYYDPETHNWLYQSTIGE